MNIRKFMPGIFATLITGIVLGSLGITAFIYLGLYNVSALDQHSKTVYWIADQTRVWSVGKRADNVEVPDLSNPELEQKGFGLYHLYCELCHGAPGVAPQAFALGMQPLPTAIVGISRKRQEKPQEMYWVIENGVKMTGMPAWKYRLTDTEIWEIVAFLGKIPYLTAAEYKQRVSAFNQTDFESEAQLRLSEESAALENISLAERGIEVIQQYGCTSCHRIPGITAAVNDVGPPLNGMAERAFIAGILANNPDNMTSWLRFPNRISPQTMMPDLGVKEEDAKAMAAYLATLKEE